MVDKDIIDIELNLSLNEIKSMKKNKFKKYLKKKIHSHAFTYLKNLQQTHSKVKNIKYSELEKAPYLINSHFKNEEKYLLFKLRTSMINVKANFSSRYANISCDLCDENVPQTQEHLFDCKEIIKNCPQLYNDRNTEYGDIFEGTRKQLKCTQLFKNILDTKQMIEDKNNQVNNK